MSEQKIRIGDKVVGGGEPCFIVAEISCNHLQNKEYALKLVEEAKKAGADAVKFQAYTPDILTINEDNEYFRMEKSIWRGKTLYELYSEAYTPMDWFPELKQKTEREGLVFLSSVFDEGTVDFLEDLGAPAYKLASFEINHIPLLKKIAKTGKPIILSTGVAELEDIGLAINTLRESGAKEIIVLKCVSSYPAPYVGMNLKIIPDIRERFGVLTGLSDHSMTPSVPVAAVALGADMIEKHFILDRKSESPDRAFSLMPKEFADTVKLVREAEAACGKADYTLSKEAKEHKFFMRSIFAVKNIKSGEKFTEDNIRIIRPGYGLHPRYYEEALGHHANSDINRGTPLTKEMID